MVVLAAAAGACTPAVPGTPSYERDVRPIFMANCVRCHGAGGTVQNEANGTQTGKIECFLNVYDDPTDCPDGGTAAPCQPGAHTCATSPSLKVFFPHFLHPASGGPRMPPAPSEPLNSWELDVVDRWLANPIP